MLTRSRRASLTYFIFLSLSTCQIGSQATNFSGFPQHQITQIGPQSALNQQHQLQVIHPSNPTNVPQIVALDQAAQNPGPAPLPPSQFVSEANSIKPLIQAALAPIIGQPSIKQHKKVAIDRPKPSPSPTYMNEDPIIYVDYASINDEILHKPTASFVYFNANFNNCRNCHRFFSTWRDLANDIRWWRQVIKLYVINCSDEDNIDICRRAGVTQFPQVKFYWIMSNSLDQDGQRLRILGKSVHAMRHLIMDKVLDSYAEHNKMLAHKSRIQSKGPIGVVAANPFLSMMGPFMSILEGGSTNSGGSNPLSAIMNLLSGKGLGSGGIGGLIQSLGGVQGMSQLLNMLTSATTMRQQLSVQPLPRNWPEFEPIEVSGTQQLLDMLPLDPSKNIGALLIMETQEFLYTGLEVMLDLNPYSNQTYIARVRDERGQLSKNLTKRDDIIAPALIYITELRQPELITTATKYANDEDLRRSFVRSFERQQVKYPVKRVRPLITNINRNNSSESSENEETLSKLNFVYMDDLTNAIRGSLMDQVFRHPDLSDDQHNALVKYVYTLINYFPFDGDQLIFIKRLHTWLQNQVSPVDVGEYKKQFHDIGNFIPKRDWVACKSLSNSKAIPSRNRRPGLFENPAQFGKVVSNITRLFKSHQQQASKLKNLFNVFTANLSQNQKVSRPTTMPRDSNSTVPPAHSTTTKAPNNSKSSSNGIESPIERIIKSLTSTSLGSDSSILRLISTALTGGSESESKGSGKSKFAREFPCGAWKLAHVMVVSEYVKDSPRKDVKHIVLQSLYQYMLHFYACSTCGNRVSDISSEFRLHLEDNLVDQADSVMLLWKIHNRVNKRLEVELRPGSPTKVQFPTESLCPKCRMVKARTDLISTPNWSDKQVLNFLVHHYRPKNIIASSSSGDSSASLRLWPNHLDTWILMTLSMALNLFSFSYLDIGNMR